MENLIGSVFSYIYSYILTCVGSPNFKYSITEIKLVTFRLIILGKHPAYLILYCCITFQFFFLFWSFLVHISSEKAIGTPLQYSCLEGPMGRGAWWAAVHGVAKSWTRLRDFTFTFHFHAWEKEMATHSSVLAWRIPGTGEPGGMLSMGLHRVGHN